MDAGQILYRLQHGWDEFRFMLKMDDPTSPNDYFARNIWATFQSDPVGVQTREQIGTDRLMWGSDYPHGDSTWPESRDTINWNFQEVAAADVAQVVQENVTALYGLS